MAYIALLPESWESVCSRVAAAPSEISWRWAAIRETDRSWKFATLAVSAESANAKAEFLRYESVILASETLSPTEAANRLRAGAVTEDSHFSDLRFTLATGQLYPRHRTTGHAGPYRSHSGWPEFEVQHDSERATVGTQISNLDQLVEDGRPIYPSGADAVAHFVFREPTDRRDLTRVGTVLIRLPDRRARIAEVRILRNRITATVDGDLEGMCLRAYWRVGPESTEPGWHDFNDLSRRVRLPVSSVPHEAAMYLVGPGGAVLDHRGWTGTYGDLPPLDEWEPRGIMARIRSGEDDRTEFKQVVKERGTYQKLARTVAAFANGAGGVIFVGIADDSTVIGAAATVRSSIDDALQQRVTPRPRYRWRALRLQGKPVQGLEVYSGKPLIHRADHMVWVRAQGTTREAQSDDLQELASSHVLDRTS